jgi:LAO/AO transport system kinase
LHLFPAKPSGWTVPVLSCSSINAKGFEAIASKMDEYFRLIALNGYLEEHRKEQNNQWLDKAIEEELLHSLMQQTQVKSKLTLLRALVNTGKMSPFDAAQQLVKTWNALR